MAVQAGAKYLERYHGGRGLLLGGVPGVPPADVVILGGGVVGTNAAKIAAGMGAHVRILDVSLHRLRYLADVMPANVDLIYSNRHNILEQLERADLLVGAVLLPGAKAPNLVLREDLKRMKQGAVIVDVAVDQGGCVETIHPTTHEDPIYEIDGVIHYGVANMPGRRAAHLHPGAHQRHLPLRRAPRAAGLEGGVPGRPRARAGPEHRAAARWSTPASPRPSSSAHAGAGRAEVTLPP